MFETNIPFLKFLFRGVPQVQLDSPNASMKMQYRKTTVLFTLGIIVALMVSTLIVEAAESPNQRKISAEYRNRALNAFQMGPWQGQAETDDDIELDDLDDINIDGIVDDYEHLTEVPPPSRCIWVLWARGFSWLEEDVPETSDSEVPEDSIPMGMRLAARPIWFTEDGVLFKVIRGGVQHGEETYSVEGYGFLLKTGKFYVKLWGDGIKLRAIGKVYLRNAVDVAARRRCRYYFVRMKGKMTVDNEDYIFHMRGRAFRLCLAAAKPTTMPAEPSTLTTPT